MSDNTKREINSSFGFQASVRCIAHVTNEKTTVDAGVTAEIVHDEVIRGIGAMFVNLGRGLKNEIVDPALEYSKSHNLKGQVVDGAKSIGSAVSHGAVTAGKAVAEGTKAAVDGAKNVIEFRSMPEECEMEEEYVPVHIVTEI